MGSSVACHASKPLVNIYNDKGPIIDADTNKKFLLNERANQNPILNLESGLFDFEIDSLPQDYKSGHAIQDQISFSKNFSLSLYNTHTEETLNYSINQNFGFADLKLREFNTFCRDWRQNKIIPMDPNLLVRLIKIADFFVENNAALKINILSAYRTNKTNEMLRRNSSYVAKNSFHILGKAIDFNIAGVSVPELKDAVGFLSSGGVGIYKSFVHLDTGPRRRW